MVNGRLTILMGTSRETSDFIVDGIEHWWQTNQIRLGSIRQLTIDLDNGPANASGRTQFIKRMVAFADRHQLEIELVYYPPYHSKYNPIERCWGMLEQHWNGTLLNSVDTVLEWARTMTWKGVHPVVELLDKTYEKGVRIARKRSRNLKPVCNGMRRCPNTMFKFYHSLVEMVEYFLGVTL